MILSQKREFLIFDQDEAKPVDFHRTKWKVHETQKQIFNVTADSLNRWLSLPCISAQAQSLTEFFGLKDHCSKQENLPISAIPKAFLSVLFRKAKINYRCK